MYDNSALVGPPYAQESIGDYVMVKKQFFYNIGQNVSGKIVGFAEKDVTQTIKVKRVANTVVTATDWQGLGNSFTLGFSNCKITSDEVRALVGGTAPIVIDPGANN